MKKLLICLFFISLLLTKSAFCEFHADKIPPSEPDLKQIREIDTMLEKRLNLTAEQKSYLKASKQERKKEIEKIVNRMQVLHDNIRDVYLLGLPKFQTDLRTAAPRAELAILKQNADKLRAENRKNFESILDENQKNEFEKIKKEYALNRDKPPHLR